MTIQRVTMRDSEKIDADTLVGERLFSFKVTLGGSSHAVNFKALGLLPMANATYRIWPAGETAALIKVDESTITEAGFTILGGGASEIAHVLIQGVQTEE